MQLGFIQGSNARSGFIDLGGDCGSELRLVGLQHTQKRVDHSCLPAVGPGVMQVTAKHLLLPCLVLQKGWESFEVLRVLEHTLHLMHGCLVRVKYLR